MQDLRSVAIAATMSKSVGAFPAIKALPLTYEKSGDVRAGAFDGAQKQFVHRTAARNARDTDQCTLLAAMVARGTDERPCVVVIDGIEEVGGELYIHSWVLVNSTADEHWMNSVYGY